MEERYCTEFTGLSALFSKIYSLGIVCMSKGAMGNTSRSMWCLMVTWRNLQNYKNNYGEEVKLLQIMTSKMRQK